MLSFVELAVRRRVSVVMAAVGLADFRVAISRVNKPHRRLVRPDSFLRPTFFPLVLTFRRPGSNLSNGSTPTRVTTAANSNHSARSRNIFGVQLIPFQANLTVSTPSVG